jgi:uncharacterized membrane protein YoaK (UPF0700 family)
MKNHRIAALLGFVAGFVDTAGFLGLQGLFTAHVTGYFVTLGATLVLGTHGIVAKLLALPEFILVVALARLAGAALAARRWPTVRLLLIAKVVLLMAFFVLAVSLGPFPDSDAPAALATGFAGVAAMAVQNAVQRVHLGSLPPSTLMTGNTTQMVLDAVDLMRGAAPDQAPGGAGQVPPHAHGDRLVRRRLCGRCRVVCLGRILVPRGPGRRRRRERDPRRRGLNLAARA